MGIETSIDRLAAAIEKLAAAAMLNEGAQATKPERAPAAAEAEKEKPEKPKAATSEKPAPEKPKAASETAGFQMKDVAEQMKKLLAAEGRDAALALLQEYGASKVPDLKAEQYGDVIGAIKTRLA
jgi:hypothetical protein